MAGILISRGHTQVKQGEGCDVCIINTCAVTAESARKSRQLIRRLRKIEPGALIAVCGCFSQLEPATAKALGADLIGGSGNRREFALEIERIAAEDTGDKDTGGNTGGRFCCVDPFEELPPGGGATTRTRALLKIQDGCDNFCAYCIVPYVRGRVRSLPIERAAEQARLLDEQGFREIVVTGIEIASYGKTGELPSVAKAIADAAPRARIRLGSLDPRIVTEDFCGALAAIPNLCDHFHLSLQSGCDETLRRMGRKYSARDVLDSIKQLRRCFPDCGITADLITGFPGETDAEFELTMRLIRQAGFSGMHIFPYSPRPGTRAAAMPEQVEKNVRIRRARTAAAAAEQMSRDFIAGQTGKTVEVLFERKRDGLWTGHSGNYLEVTVKSGGGKNQIYPVKITGAENGVVTGEILVSR